MVKGKVMSLLVELGMDRKLHSSGSLMAHLYNTHELLRAWGHPEYLCLAGLFHNVYGTKSDTPRSVPTEKRSRIRTVIGERPESLAYIFCVADERPFFKGLEGASTKVRNRLDGSELTIPSETRRDLAEIEAANWIEQLPRYSLSQDSLDELRLALESARETVSSVAYESLHRALLEKSREQPLTEWKPRCLPAKRSGVLTGVITNLRRFRLSRV
jgi:hypothetical protein